MTTPLRLAAAAGLALAATAAGAHQIWIEQAGGRNAVIRFGEFGENLREASPGLLDKFGKPAATLLSAQGAQARTADAVKTADGYALPFAAARGEAIVAEDAAYPLYTWKQGDKDTTHWFRPAARLVTGFAALPPKLVLDLVPTGRPGEFRLFFRGQPRPGTKVTLVTPSGWSRDGHTDADGVVAFPMPWQGPYVAEVGVDERSGGERPGRSGTDGPERYDGVSFVTTLSFVKPDGLPALPAGPAATPAAPAAPK